MFRFGSKLTMSASGGELIPDLPPESKSVALEEVTEVRRGTDPDPESGSGQKTGTAILRRNISDPTVLAICCSLIAKDRTLDIQCLSQQDFNVLFHNLKQLIANQKR
jgi:hypothetical protein